MPDMTETKPPKRTPDDVWGDIERFLSTTDGIATADAFRLGKLVKEYGEKCAGEAVGQLMEPLLKGLEKSFKKEPPKEPWE